MTFLPYNPVTPKNLSSPPHGRADESGVSPTRTRDPGLLGFGGRAVANSSSRTARAAALSFPRYDLGRISGVFWLAAGLLLTIRGLALDLRLHSPLMIALGGGIAVALGFFKGQMVLKRLALLNLARLAGLPQPSPLYRMFAPGTWALIGFFMALGLLLRVSPLPVVVRSTILLAVGFALLLGGIHILRNLRMTRGGSESLGETIQPPSRTVSMRQG